MFKTFFNFNTMDVQQGVRYTATGKIIKEKKAKVLFQKGQKVKKSPLVEASSEKIKAIKKAADNEKLPLNIQIKTLTEEIDFRRKKLAAARELVRQINSRTRTKSSEIVSERKQQTLLNRNLKNYATPELARAATERTLARRQAKEASIIEKYLRGNSLTDVERLKGSYKTTPTTTTKRTRVSKKMRETLLAK